MVPTNIEQINGYLFKDGEVRGGDQCLLGDSITEVK